jgi:hypothetical protein
VVKEEAPAVNEPETNSPVTEDAPANRLKNDEEPAVNDPDTERPVTEEEPAYKLENDDVPVDVSDPDTIRLEMEASPN